jgi:uncharacterized membrane protein YidH (DUF202 family)
MGRTGDGAGQNTNRRRLAWLGVVLGLGLVTKTTFVPVAMAVAVTLLLVWWREGDRAWGGLVRSLGVVFGPALLIAVPWWLRNMSLYGGLDIYGLANHDAIVVGQPRTADWIREQGLGAWLERGITFTFQSFWGQFGWMGVLMPTWLYRALALGVGGLVIGFLLWLGRAGATARRKLKTHNTQYFVLATTVLLVVLAYLYYNRTFVQHQGRYLFPALIPIALGVVLAVEAWVRLLRLPDWLHPLACAMPYLALAALDLYALWRFIVPALT